MNTKHSAETCENQSPHHRAALNYASNGLAVFPCIEGGKRPACENGFHDATTDAALISAWWAENPNYNIGAVPFSIGCTVVDLDKKNGKDGVAAFAALCQAHGVEAPKTRTVTTPSGGFHLWLTGVVEKDGPQSALAQGVDIKCVDGYVVMPPSVIDGVPYRWTDTSPRIALPDFLPSALAALLARAPAKASEPTGEPISAQEMRERLYKLDPACPRDKWVRVAAALSQTPCTNPRFDKCALFVEWSRNGGDVFASDEDCETTFLSVDKPGGINAGTFIHMTREAGYRTPELWQGYESEDAEFSIDRLKAIFSGGIEAPYVRRRATTAAQLEAEEISPPRYLWEGFYFEKHVNLNWGDGGAGKTLMMEQLAVAVAAGYDLFGRKTIQKPVTLVLAEDDKAATRQRMQRICADRHLNFSDLPIQFFNMQGEDAHLIRIDKRDEVTFGPFLRDLAAHMQENPGSFVGLDTMVDMADIDPNLPGPVAKLCKVYLQGLCLKLDQTLLVNAHPSKAAMASGEGYAGSTAWKASVRAMTGLRRPTERDEPSHKRYLDRLKNNFAGDEPPMSLFMIGGLLRQTEVSSVSTEQVRADIVRFIDSNQFFRVLMRKNGAGSGVQPKSYVREFNEKFGHRLSERQFSEHADTLESQGLIWYDAPPKGKSEGWKSGPNPKIWAPEK